MNAQLTGCNCKGSNLKVIEGETIIYDREQACLKKDNTPTVLVADPLIFTWAY